MTEMFRPNLKILPPQQRRLWDELADVPSTFTLYGGTAIALHLGHRTSIDFDFFGSESFDPDKVVRGLSFLNKAKVTQKNPDTLTMIVDRGGSVQVSFFGVPDLKRLRDVHVCEDNGLRVASLLDLAGTKAAVVQKRAEAKDYIDIDAIVETGAVDLSQSLAASQAIYGDTFNVEQTLKALCYYGDGNLDTVPRDVRERLVRAVQGVQLANLPQIETNDPHGERGNDR